ncbi:hypothetical protein [Flagellimonas lutimaris]|uniref:hypothetical protein n=1 Tax=Flagellimonas lutimaris TaxID=475082 RepID=UPI003F5CF197
MPPRPISSTFTNFLHQSTPTQLQITFTTLEIRNHQNGRFLNQVQRQQSRIILQKMPCSDVVEITVADNLVFSFSFQFHIPSSEEIHDIKILSLPRPLSHGRLHVDEEKLWLSFRIDAPDPTLCVEVTHVYQGISKLERCCAPLCGQMP